MTDGAPLQVLPLCRGQSRLQIPEVIGTGHAVAVPVRESVQPPVAARFIGMVAANVGDAGYRCRLVLQIELAVGGTNARDAADLATRIDHDPTIGTASTRNARKAGSELALETKLARVIVRDGGRRGVRIVVALVACAEMQ